MKKSIRILMVLLVCLMIVPMFAACGNGDGADTTKPTGNQPSGNQETTTPGEGGVKDPNYIAPIDMDGYVFKALVRSKDVGDSTEALQNGSAGFYCEDFWVAEESQDALSFAVYTRNLTIQEDFNCRIAQVDQHMSMYQQLMDAYDSGETYEMTVILATHAASAATSNLLRDINSMDYVDLTHAAYDQNSIKELSMGGKLYYLSGDMNISTMDNAIVSVVNMVLFDSLKETFLEVFNDELFTDPYEMVAEGEWTLDNQLTMAELANVDMNKSDGALSHAKGDTIGYFQYGATPLYYFYGSGARISELDEDGYPTLVIDSDLAQETYDYLYREYNVVSKPWMPRGFEADRRPNVLSGQVLFVDYLLWDVRKTMYPQSTFEYGLLPLPLFTDGQERHYTVMYWQNCVNLWAMPNMCADPDLAARMLQIMAVYSSKKDSTMDAYYQKTMYMTVATDMGSRNALNMVKDSIVYDIALLYGWGAYKDLLLKIGTASANGYAHGTANIDTATAQMEITLEQFKNPQHVPDAQ
ncbi:MAG: hypothetical protein IJW50_05930 [Clostridia bacterium]|nr:hypothetical protein [Clostridia bacterium]